MSYYIIPTIPDKPYLLWQIELQAYNLYKLGLLKFFKPLVGSITPSIYARQLKEKGIGIEFIKDTRVDKKYIPSIRPNLIKNFLKNNPEIKNIFVIDQDVIFREFINIDSLLVGDTWHCSDTISYIGSDYVKSKGEEQFKELCLIVGIDSDFLISKQKNSGGAQWIIKNSTFEFWDKVERDCNTLYAYMINNEKKYKGDDYPIQKWCAEMWSLLWNSLMRYDVKINKELEFSWASDSMNRYDKTKILHMAGIIDNRNGTVFYKGEFINKSPFDLDMNQFIQNNNTCSKFYAELIKEYSQVRNTIHYK
jgi:hypothetical protein